MNKDDQLPKLFYLFTFFPPPELLLFYINLIFNALPNLLPPKAILYAPILIRNTPQRGGHIGGVTRNGQDFILLFDTNMRTIIHESIHLRHPYMRELDVIQLTERLLLQCRKNLLDKVRRVPEIRYTEALLPIEVYFQAILEIRVVGRYTENIEWEKIPFSYYVSK